MENKSRFHPEFPPDLSAALDYLEQFSVRTGNSFREALRNRIHLIGENPELFAVAYDDVRIARIPKFAYSVHYRLVGNTPKFLALLHTSKGSENWPARK